MSSRNFLNEAVETRTASFTLGLPAVQAAAPGVTFVGDTEQLSYFFRVFRFGSLIYSSTLVSLGSLNVPDLHFKEIPRKLSFDIVVICRFDPKVSYVVFPLQLNVRFEKLRGLYFLKLPGFNAVDWRATLQTSLLKTMMLLRRLGRRKTP